MLSIPAPMILLALLLAAGTGALAGKVTLSGLAPRLAPLPVTRDMKVCGNNKPDESVEVSQGGGVRNAVVWLTDVPVPKDVKTRKEKLDQQHCAFVPHVVVAPVGSTVEVVNSDKALHNVRAQAGDVKLMNYAMPIPGHVVPTKLKKEGTFKVSCDVHNRRGWKVRDRRPAPRQAPGEDLARAARRAGGRDRDPGGRDRNVRRPVQSALMAAQLDPAFLVTWVLAELGQDSALFDALCTRAQDDGLGEEEAELDVAGQLAERGGLLDALERAAGDLWLSEVREARGATEKLERSGGAACIAWLRATRGAADRLEHLARALAGEPGKAVGEVAGVGGAGGRSAARGPGPGRLTRAGHMGTGRSCKRGGGRWGGHRPPPRPPPRRARSSSAGPGPSPRPGGGTTPPGRGGCGRGCSPGRLFPPMPSRPCRS